MREYNSFSRVEEIARERFGLYWEYPFQRIKFLIVPDFPTLGKIVALRFIEWLQLNPEGVVSLPTGKTPEYFIEWTSYFLTNWNKKHVKRELEKWGIDIERKPDMKNYYFVQMDEFYPMNPKRENSFVYYIKKYYLKGFGFDPKKMILMETFRSRAISEKNLYHIFPDGKVDLSLRYRKPKNQLEELQQKAIYDIDRFAAEYEEKIEKLGGIGFFLGGIGPDGHIAFNIRGSDHNSTTRVLNINYETAAASSVDLGGIEVARNKAVITIGLKTITQNPTTTAIIFASGESKAKVVKDSIENEPDILYPATALHKLSAARFYLTKGASSLLTGVRIEKLKNYEKVPEKEIARIFIDIANKKKKRLKELTKSDLKNNIFGKILVDKKIHVEKEKNRISLEIVEKIRKGTEVIKGVKILHTAPHHDDIMLGYLPFILHLVRVPENRHFFATFTSGFTSVSNHYTLRMINVVEEFLEKGLLDSLLKEKDYFNPKNLTGRNRDIFQYLDGVAAQSDEMKKEAEARRMLRNIVEITGSSDIGKVKKEIKRLKLYLLRTYPGKKDIPEIQKLKGMIREWEEELLWAHLGFNCNHIFHLRLGFYTGDIFTPTPEYTRDIKPVITLLERISPDIITVAFDPEGTGPDTHYKVLQIVAESLREYLKKHKNKNLKIWGYRNVWFRFHPADANIYVPVSMNSIAILKSAFDICFGSQRSASFPSYEYDGPFSELAVKIMVEQYSVIKNIIGRDFFYSNPVPRLRATRGMVFIKEMNPEELLEEAEELKKLMETL